MIDLNRELKVVMRTGKLAYGFNTVKSLLLTKRVAGVIVAAEAREDIVAQLKYYAKLANVPIYIYDGDSWDLGKLLEKPFMVSSIAIIDPGESNIMSLFEEEVEEGA